MNRQLSGIQENLKAVSNAYQQMIKRFREGISSQELFDCFQSSLKNSLGDYEILYDYIWGKDSLNIDGVTEGEYIPQKGDTLIMDISIGKNGVWCDVCRTFFVGEPTEEQRTVFAMTTKSLRAGYKALKSGVRACEIYEKVNTVYELNGKTLVHHAGHRIGEKALMQPQFLADNQTQLIAGELYTIESGLYEEFGIRLENDFLLTEEGAIDLFEELMPLKIEEYVLK